MKHALTTVVLTAAACLNVACSSFERDWGQAVQEQVPRPSAAGSSVPGRAPGGPWVGTWRSESNGHTGALRCLVRAPDAGGLPREGWEFRYHARWGMLSGEFKTTQPVEKGRSGRVVSKGDWTLPAWAGGTYHYDIEVTNTDFHGTYRSAADHGTFSMTRPDKL